MGSTNETETTRGKFLPWLKKSIVPLATLLGAIAIFAVIAWLYIRYPGFFDRLKGYGYLGVFVISVLLNATVIIPVSVMAIISSLGGALPLPFVVGLVGGVGAAIGEITGYLAGRAGRDLLAKNRIYVRVEGWVQRWGMLAVFLLSIFPLLFDVVGIIAGATRMPVWKFVLACWLGRTIIYIAVAYLGYFGFDIITRWFS